MFAKVFDLCKNLHNYLIIFLRFLYLGIVGKFLKDQIDKYFSYVIADAFEFILYIFWIFQIYDIKGDLIANTFCDNVLSYTHYYLVF